MATTLSFVYSNGEVMTLAYVGDRQCYRIGCGTCLVAFQTSEDHV